MKIEILVTLFFVIATNGRAQNIGVGTNNPVEKLDVNGAIKIGNSVTENPGTLRWNADKSDFEGYNGKTWVSLSGGKGAWGNQFSYSIENDAANFMLNENVDGYGSNLGSSLSISGNYLLAGARLDYGGSYGPKSAGTVRLFRKGENKWSVKQWYALQSPSPVAFEFFGSSTHIDGNYFIVGAPGANTNRGRAYIYTFGAAFGYPEWNATLQPADEIDGDGFGTSVSISGNYAVVGSPNRDVAGKLSQGRATTYQRNPSTGVWSIMTHLYAPDGLADDQFGRKVSISGQYAAVASPMADINGVSAIGRLYIYMRNGNTWSLSDSITAPRNLPNQKFGESVFMKNDTLVVGAIEYGGNITDGNGRVYIYVRNGAIWELQAELSAPDGKPQDNFGSSVHLSNGNLIVGAYYASRSYTFGEGKAYVFKKNGNEWKQQACLVASQPARSDLFGWSVAIADDIVFVGANQASVEVNNDNGRIYFFNK